MSTTSEALGQEFPPDTAELESAGKTNWVLEQGIVDTSGAVVATTSATYFGLGW